eukprot:2693843-Rhodomonas_salina.2
MPCKVALWPRYSPVAAPSPLSSPLSPPLPSPHFSVLVTLRSRYGHVMVTLPEASAEEGGEHRTLDGLSLVVAPYARSVLDIA